MDPRTCLDAYEKLSWSCWQTNHNSAAIGRGTMLTKLSLFKIYILMKNMQRAILLTVLQWQLSESRRDDSKMSEYMTEVFIQA